MNRISLVSSLSQIAQTAALLVCATGCISIPMGKEEFTTEYPTAIRATWDSPTKTYEVSPAVYGDEGENRVVTIVLSGTVTSEQPREQHYDKVTLEKRKRLAFGFFPNAAEGLFRPKKAMVPMNLPYVGDGRYSSNTYGAKESGIGAAGFGAFLGIYLFLYTPFSILYEPFAPYEDDRHYMGRFIDSGLRGNTICSNYSAEDVELLGKFSPSDRAKIGAWTFRENATHPQNTFWNGFSSFSWFGFDKHSYYLMHDPVKDSRKEPVAPEITSSDRKVSGPYSVTMRIPDMAFEEIVDVGPDSSEAVFHLPAATHGRSSASGFLRFLPPAAGLDAVRGEDSRELLRRAAEREWPITVSLPASRADGVIEPPSRPSYRIVAVERPDSGGLVVRVAVDDASRTFDIDRMVQPEIRRLFREQFSSGADDARQETLRWTTEDEGKTLVYTVDFQ